MKTQACINIVQLHIRYERYFTGVDRYLEMFSKGIKKSDRFKHIKVHSVYLTTEKGKIFHDIKMNSNSEINTIIPLPRSEALLFKDLFWKNNFLSIVTDFLAPYLNGKYNLIFQYHNLFLSDLAFVLKARFGGKILAHLHCLPWKFNIQGDKNLFTRLNYLYINQQFEMFKEDENSKIKYSDADGIICLSEVSKDYLIKVHNIEESMIKIVLNGLDSKQEGSFRDRTGDIIEFLYVGKISEDKGIFELLNVLKKVHTKGYCFSLKIAGNGSKKDLDRIKYHYSNLNIELLGHVSFESLQDLYKSCTIGVIPSLHEQCSYVALEMAMFGVPMIVSDVDALSEMFEHGETALLTPLIFDPDFGLSVDEDKFAENIIRLIKDNKLRRKLSANIRRKFHERFTLKEMIVKTEEVYKQLISQPCP